tara:strand:+ start:10019 stop:10435 length:417 start_codon:yes stop_codon:yes gene_type:complete
MLTMLRNGRSILAQGLLTLALLAAVIEAGLPRGYMLDRDAGSGVISVVLCTSQGAQQLWLDLETGETRDGEAPAPANDHRDRACAFAVAATAIGPLPLLPVFPAPARVHSASAPAPQALAVASDHHPRPPARAPPVSL